MLTPGIFLDASHSTHTVRIGLLLFSSPLPLPGRGHQGIYLPSLLPFLMPYSLLWRRAFLHWQEGKLRACCLSEAAAAACLRLPASLPDCHCLPPASLSRHRGRRPASCCLTAASSPATPLPSLPATPLSQPFEAGLGVLPATVTLTEYYAFLPSSWLPAMPNTTEGNVFKCCFWVRGLRKG